MSNLDRIQKTASLVAGFICFVVSALLLNVYSSGHEKWCGTKSCEKDCESVNYVLAGGSFGIIASLFQIVSVFLGYKGFWRLWCIVQLLIVFFSLVAFSIAIKEGVHTNSNCPDKNESTKGKAFCASVLLNAIFSLCMVTFIFCFRLGMGMKV